MKKKTIVLSLFSAALFATVPMIEPFNVFGDTNIVEAASNASHSEAIKVSKYGNVVKDDYPMWRNFKWVKKSDTKNLFNQTVFVKFKYDHSNGSSYYSLYNQKNEWLGYVNSKAVKMASGKQGNGIKVNKTVQVKENNYPIHQNFGWKKKNDSKNLKNQSLTVKYEYNHFNGSTYYSLYNQTGDWEGYINQKGVTENIEKAKPAQGDAIKVNKYVTVANGNYDMYRNFSWKKKNKASSFINQTLEVKYEYHHQNGMTYYSTYDNQGEWQGYINAKAAKEVGAEGPHYKYNKYVSLKNEKVVAYREFKDLTNNVTVESKRKETPILAKGFYKHFSGENFYSLYQGNKWLGYVAESDLKLDVSEAGKGYKVSKKVVVADTKQKTYQNFNWKTRHATKDLEKKVFTVTRVYSHLNGADYYSLFDDNNTWYGYVNSKFVKGVVPTLKGVEDKTIYLSDKTFEPLKGVEATDYNGKKLEVKVADGAVDMKKPGVYVLTYSTRDSDGNLSESKATITLIDDHAPVFSEIKDVTMNQTPKEFDAKENISVKDFSGDVIDYQVSGEVNTKKAGKYELVYTAKDKRNHTTTVKRTITVKKVAEPILSGVKNTSVKKSEKTIDLLKGIEATDYNGKSLEVSITGNVNMEKSGIYELVYTAKDDVDQIVTAKRQVEVINDIKPVITGASDKKQNILVGSFDPKEGVSATDSDGNSLDINVSGEVNPAELGKYELIYQVKDKAGNETKVNRLVEIFEVQPESVIIMGDSKEKVGRTTQMVANVQPTDARNKDVVWVSSNPEVATVDVTGHVTTIKEGFTTISATTSNGVVGSKELAVSNDLSGRLFISGTASINNAITSLTFNFNSSEKETLNVKRIEVSEGLYLTNTVFTEAQLAEKGISSVISPYSSFGLTVSNRFGWDREKVVVKLTVATDDGIEKTFETRPR